MIATPVTASEVETGLTPAEKRHFGALERKIEAGMQTFREVGTALLEIRDTRLYRETHTSFEVYCAERWDLDKNRAYQFIGAAEVSKALGDPSDLTNEAQARELVPIMHEDPKALQAIWSQVQASNQPVTASLIRQIKDKVIPPTDGVHEPSLTDVVVERIQALTRTLKRWNETKPSRKERSLVSGALEALDEVAI